MVVLELQTSLDGGIKALNEDELTILKNQFTNN